MTTIKDFTLKYNCVVVQQNDDAGDAPQETAMACFGLNDTTNYKKAYNFFEIAPGEICRDKQQYPNPLDISRDQLDPTLIMLGQSDMKTELWDHFKVQLKGMFLYPNGDVPSPHQFFGIMMRASNSKWFYPFLFFTDLSMCVESFLYLFNNDPNETDDDNHVCRMYQAQLRMPTLFSWLARKMYVKFRKANYGCTLGEVWPAMQAIAWKHRAETGGNPAMVSVWRPIVSLWYE